MLALAIAGPGCGREPADRAARPGTERPRPLAVQVLADTAEGRRLRVEPGEPRVWMDRVAPAVMTADGPRLPEATAETRIPEPPPPRREADPGLKPPILREAGVLARTPRVARANSREPALVDLEVLVDERGDVAEARWAGGSEDTSLVNAARRCALGMRFYPALREGRPVAVWCRQRFDFTARP